VVLLRRGIVLDTPVAIVADVRHEEIATTVRRVRR
jgi:hypothetical protein